MRRYRPTSFLHLCIAVVVLLAALPANAGALGPGVGTFDVSIPNAWAQDSSDDAENGTTRTPRTTSEAEPSAAVSFTGPVYGYTVSYDPDVWGLGHEIYEGSVDGVQLMRDNSTFTIWAWEAYGSDPVVCLDGEVDYYSNVDEYFSEWETALGADGQPLRFESDDLAWGVFHSTYTDDFGESYPQVHFFSCQPIPGQDASLMMQLFADPEAYNEELDHALDVMETLQFADVETPVETEEAAEPGTPDPAQESGEIISTSLEGSQYTSPNYGYTATVGLQWQVLEEVVEDGEEWLVVSNGTSVVTLWATDAYSGDLTGCVDFAAGASGLDLTLDTDAAGADFRGTYRNEAFANFVYEQDGIQMMYFVKCQMIGATGGYLILIQDVPYDEFTAERRFRIEIENSIEMPY